MPAITVLLRAWPDGKEKAYSYGGTASASGGRIRPTSALPTVVIDSEPAAASTIRYSGVRDRHRTTISSVMEPAMIVIPTGPPRWVNQVAMRSLVAVRSEIASFSAGRSIPAMPSPSSTASYTPAPAAVSPTTRTTPSAAVMTKTACADTPLASEPTRRTSVRPRPVGQWVRSRRPMCSSARVSSFSMPPPPLDPYGRRATLRGRG